MIEGVNFIGQTRSKKGTEQFSTYDASANQPLSYSFYEATTDEVYRAAQVAQTAYQRYSRLPASKRAEFLEAIADEITALGDELISIGIKETALPEGRLKGERGRTVGQIKMFADLIRKGDWVDARIDTADPDRTPVPKPDTRSMRIALGPVAIFGASNFPLAFSVAGGDTASALASGCPVVVKAHPSHPATSELVAKAILKAAKATEMPDGVFSMLHGRSHKVGQSLVEHEQIKAVGFTGSFQGGKALFDLATRRKEPIPVFAEMGSVNPVFVLPKAFQNRSKEIAQGYAQSLTLGVGQFCTNPGLLFHFTQDGQSQFDKALEESLSNIEPGTMLNSGIKERFTKSISQLAGEEGMTSIAAGKQPNRADRVQAQVLQTDYKAFIENPHWSEEVFGPSSLVVRTSHVNEMMDVARQMSGHLTATVLCEDEELSEFAALLDILREKVGRLIINGFPTGVEVCHSMVHGGPYPATTAPSTTSVGSMAISRFTRPLCYQNFPQTLLPEELQDHNPLQIWRLLNGELTKDEV